MFKTRFATLCLTLAMVSMAQADAVIVLTALTPPNAGDQYAGGAVVDFQVDVSADAATGSGLRLAQLDFGASDGALVFLGPDGFPSGGDGIPEFTFDYSSLVSDALYAGFPNYPKPNVSYSGTSPIPGFILAIPAGGSLTLGTGHVQLPAETGVKTTYMLDAVNAGASDPQNRGAQLHFGFGGADPIIIWAAGQHQFRDGVITGEPLGLTVVPEPATLTLLALGGIAALSRRNTR